MSRIFRQKQNNQQTAKVFFWVGLAPPKVGWTPPRKSSSDIGRALV
uniref:Uncharacterized protein n=1 Tax=Rhizophora mucronata TaxID=61149 RepID=A0A2P2NPU6_RHIMU